MDQPHILVTGDAWQYVPFGRARLKSLRATGLSYASQSYTVDGTTIKVRIVGDQSFIQVHGDPALYCESGQLTWPFRPRYSPLWGEAATWKFMDIPVNSKYLGLVSIGETTRGKQVNDPILVDGMRSEAIGWPKADTGNGPENEIKDKETQEKYFGNTITKKKAMSKWPSSLFSGKMRLFMQSLYGAREPDPEKGYFPFLIDDVDEPTALSFRGSLEGGALLIVRPDSMGIFSAPDGTYWLLDINEGPRNVLVNKINTSKAESLVKQLKDMSADERTKAEAYIFANSTIEIPKIESTVYATGSFDMPPGSQMAYGWKWSDSGSKASMVLHETLGDSIPTTRWRARTVHLTFTYTAKTKTTPARVNVSGSITDHNDWIDGWGEYNMFVPPPNGGYAPLSLYTLRAGAGLIPPLFKFPATPIYGWYIGESWTPWILTSLLSAETVVTSETSGLTYGGPEPTGTTTPGVGGATDGATGYMTHYTLKEYGDGRTISFGSYSLDGRSYRLEDRRVTTAIFGNHGTINGTGWWFGNGVETDQGGLPHASTTFTAMKAVQQSLGASLYTKSIAQTFSKRSEQNDGNITVRFVFIIPGGDAEAAYVADSRHNDTKGVITDESMVAGCTGKFYYFRDNPPPQTAIEVGNGVGWLSFPYQPILGDWVDESGATHPAESSFEQVATPVPSAVTSVYCFAGKTIGKKGKPGGSYTSLFECSYYYPFYDRGMYVFSSYGGRYIMSEGPSNPSSITWHNFVGWA